MPLALGTDNHRCCADRIGRARDSDRRWGGKGETSLLVVDPDATQQADLVRTLEGRGRSVGWCVDGGQALVEYGRVQPETVLLAPDLGAVDAVIVARTIRAVGSTPVLVGVGPGDAEAAGPILLAGASMLVSRPYLAAQILHHLEADGRPPAEQERLRYGPVVLDWAAYSVRINGVELGNLPLKEFELLGALMRRPDHVVTANELRETLWATSTCPSSNALSVHIARLRARLVGHLAVRSVRGMGYRLTLP